jgi:hypothetical protein
MMGERAPDLASDPGVCDLLGDAADEERTQAAQIDRPDLVDQDHAVERLARRLNRRS